MRSPRWLIIDPPSKWRTGEDGRSMIVGIRVRTWHPGFWLYAIKTHLRPER